MAELLAPTPRRVDLLVRVLHEFRQQFGGTTLIPPHNFVDAAVAERCLGEGFHVSRALMDHEVAAMGLDPHVLDDRAEAKRRRPWYTSGPALVIYQSAAVSAEAIRRHPTTPHQLAASIMDIVRPAGAGVITFHWWDFLRNDGGVNEVFVNFAVEFLAACERLGAEAFVTISSLAATL